MKVYLIYKYKSDNEKYNGEFMAFHTNGGLTEFSIRLYKDMHVHEVEMSEKGFENFYNMHKNKEIIMLKNLSTHIGYLISRRCDIKEAMRGYDIRL